MSGRDSVRSARLARCEAANELLRVIASCGRKFFAHEGRVAAFEVDHRGRIWFVDGCSRRRIYTHYKYRWRGFTHGGTMRNLCGAIRDHIGHGKLLNPSYFGPWPDWYSGGDPWGYGADMQRVREAAARLGITAPPAPAEASGSPA